MNVFKANERGPKRILDANQPLALLLSLLHILFGVVINFLSSFRGLVRLLKKKKRLKKPFSKNQKALHVGRIHTAWRRVIGRSIRSACQIDSAARIVRLKEKLSRSSPHGDALGSARRKGGGGGERKKSKALKGSNH